MLQAHVDVQWQNNHGWLYLQKKGLNSNFGLSNFVVSPLAPVPAFFGGNILNYFQTGHLQQHCINGKGVRDAATLFPNLRCSIDYFINILYNSTEAISLGLQKSYAALVNILISCYHTIGSFILLDGININLVHFKNTFWLFCSTEYSEFHSNLSQSYKLNVFLFNTTIIV